MAKPRSPRLPDLRAWATPTTGRFRFGRDASQAPASPFVPFGAWLAAHDPDYQWTAHHFRAMQSRLDALTTGRVTRQYFQVPIRHGKTEHNTIRYGAYRLALTPRTRLIVCSYNQRIAEKFSRAIRRLARRLGVQISPDRDTAGDWETTAGGGVAAYGAGAGLASINADVILIDDPVGSRDEAESVAHRDRVWDWITNDILARCEPRTAVLMTMSRWHEDDAAGRLRDQQRDRWQVLDLPAEAEEDDPLGRTVGAPLWPEERGAAWLAEKRAELGEYGFASLLQGRPRPRSGGMFKWAWWQLMETVPAVGPMIRYWDLAGTEPKHRKHDPDYSAGVLVCRMPDARTAIVDIARDRLGIAERDAWVLATARADRAAYGSRVRWWIETEAGIAGVDRTATLVRQIHAVGLSVTTEHPTGPKVARADPLASAAGAGNVVLCPGDWRDTFRAEAAAFPHGKHDDMIDAAAGALAKLAVPGASVTFSRFS